MCLETRAAPASQETKPDCRAKYPKVRQKVCLFLNAQHAELIVAWIQLKFDRTGFALNRVNTRFLSGSFPDGRRERLALEKQLANIREAIAACLEDWTQNAACPSGRRT
jgi:hypothetical protein